MNKLELLANHFHKMGLNIFCTINELSENNFYSFDKLKHPFYCTKTFLKKRQPIDVLKSYNWEKVNGIGLIVGFENLRVIDIDGCSNIDFINDIVELLDLPKNYEL